MVQDGRRCKIHRYPLMHQRKYLPRETSTARFWEGRLREQLGTESAAQTTGRSSSMPVQVHTACVIATPQKKCDPNSGFKNPAEAEQKARAIMRSRALSVRTLLLGKENMTLQNGQLQKGTKSEVGRWKLGQMEANYLNKKIRQLKKPNAKFITVFEQMPANVEKGKHGGSW
jgi:hypothetical protein